MMLNAMSTSVLDSVAQLLQYRQMQLVPLGAAPGCKRCFWSIDGPVETVRFA